MAEAGNENDEEMEEMEFLQGIPWQYHPLRAFLLDKLTSNEIPADYHLMGPFDVWNKYCDNELFEGMNYDGVFTRRLLTLRKQFQEGQSRAQDDLNAFNIAKTNHPPPPLNHRGEPQWNGSEAQRLLEIDMSDKKHFDLKPEDLWETRVEYKQFYLETFRNHIHQADRTRKYLHTLRLRQKEKEEERKEKAKKHVEAEAAKKKREEAKEAKEAAKKKKEEEKAAAKKKKEEEKAAKRAQAKRAKKKKEEEKKAKAAAKKNSNNQK